MLHASKWHSGDSRLEHNNLKGNVNQLSPFSVNSLEHNET